MTMDTVGDFNSAIQKYLEDPRFQGICSGNERLEELNGKISKFLNSMKPSCTEAHLLESIEDECHEYLEILKAEFEKMDELASV